MKHFCFFGGSFFKKYCWHLEFLMNQIFGKWFVISDKVRCSGQLLLKLRAVEVTTSFHWISSRSTYYQAHKSSSKLNNTVFWMLLLKEMTTKSLIVFGPLTTKWRPCKIFAKLNGNHLLMANIFNLRKYKTFGLMKMHNMCKIWFGNKIFSLCNSLIYD